MYLRGYQRHDLPALYALDRLCFEPAFRFSRSAMRKFAAAPNALVQLACERTHEDFADGLGEEDKPERLLGFTIVHLEAGEQGDLGYVVTLDVEPESRGQKIATVLMQTVENQVTISGAQWMSLHVHTANTAAIRLYERLGYSAMAVQEDFYGRGLGALVYRKALAPQT